MIIIHGQYPYNSNVLCMLGNGKNVYCCGQSLNLEILLSSDNTKNTYVSLTDGSSSITGLEMLKTTDNGYSVDVIDLAPFVKSFFDLPVNHTNGSYTQNFKEITLTIKNESESDLTYTFYAFLGAAQRGENPLITTESEMKTVATGYTAVTRGELAMNSADVLYVPEISNLNVPIYKYLTTDGTLSCTCEYTSPAVSEYAVQKDGETICTKTIKKVPYCDNTIVLKYLNQRGEFEFFVFANHYDLTTDITKSDRIYNQIDNSFNVFEKGESGAIDYSRQLVADTPLLDGIMTSKAVDLLLSRRVYMFSNSNFPNSIRQWIEVEIEGNGTINTKKNFNKFSITITQSQNAI